MGLLSKLMGNNNIVAPESEKYVGLKHLPHSICGWNWKTGRHDGTVCHGSHRWNRDTQCWVGTGCEHHISRFIEVVGDYNEWRARH